MNAPRPRRAARDTRPRGAGVSRRWTRTQGAGAGGQFLGHFKPHQTRDSTLNIYFNMAVSVPAGPGAVPSHRRRRAERAAVWGRPPPAGTHGGRGRHHFVSTPLVPSPAILTPMQIASQRAAPIGYSCTRCSASPARPALFGLSLRFRIPPMEMRRRARIADWFPRAALAPPLTSLAGARSMKVRERRPAGPPPSCCVTEGAAFRRRLLAAGAGRRGRIGRLAGRGRGRSGRFWGGI